MPQNQTGDKADDKKKSLGWGQQETVYMSNNINPFTVMPLAPNQVSGGQLTPNILVDTIGAYTTGGTIQLLADLNAEFPAEFKFNGQTIYPYEVYNPSRTSVANCGTDNTNGTFTVGLNGYPQLSMTNGQTVFQYADPRNYQVIIDGFLTTSNSVGIGQPATINHALSVSGDVLITGKVNLAGVQLANLGIATAVAPDFVFDVSGNSILRGITTLTKNTYIQGFLGLGKTSATVALDVSGSSAISNNISVTGTTFTNRLGVGKLTNWTTPYVMDILGNTRMTGSLAVSTDLDISRNMVVRGSTTIQGIGTATALNVTGNINYTQDLTGQTASLTRNLSVGGLVGIGIGRTPIYALDVNGAGYFTGALNGSNAVLYSLAITGDPRGYLSTPRLSINAGQAYPSGTYQLKLFGTAVFGSSDRSGQIGLNVDNPAYDFDMSGILNTTEVITSNLYTSNIVGLARDSNRGGANNVNINGSITNDSIIYTPKISINSGYSSKYSVNITGQSQFNGNITQSSGYLYAPIQITVIQYNSTGATGGASGQPGYWNLPDSSNVVTLILDEWPMIYVLDGSSSNTNMTLQIQTDGVNTTRTGLQFSIIARRTTGAGHTIQYPYSSGLTYTKTIAAPLSIPLVCIGPNDYSST